MALLPPTGSSEGDGGIIPNSNNPRIQMTAAQIDEKIKFLISNDLEAEARLWCKKYGIDWFTKYDNRGLDYWLRRFVTADPAMLEMKETVRLLSPVKDTVVIYGDTGTGKELIARALHGDRDTNTFIPLNCAGLPEYLLESELFGHVRGAFTGADRDKIGLMKVANNGTLFLDEIGELPLSLQAKFLRAIQEMSIRRVGDIAEEKITCRIVAATHVDLHAAVKAGKFRQDLLQRLSVFEVRLTSLTERPKDIPLIAESIDPKYPKKPFMTTEYIGNVRNIQAAIRRWQVLGK